MKRALIVGLNDYPDMPLWGCVNDAEAMDKMLKRNGDDSVNFDIMRTTCSLKLASNVLRLFVMLFPSIDGLSTYFSVCFY